MQELKLDITVASETEAATRGKKRWQGHARGLE